MDHSFEFKVIASFLELADDKEGMRYGSKAPIWSMMAYRKVPVWKRWLFSEVAVACLVLSEMIALQREYESYMGVA